MTTATVHNQNPPRSRIVSAVAALMIVAGVLVSPISFISGLMLVSQVDGSQSATFGGVITMVLLPPLAVVAGLGLRRRRYWAFILTQVLLLWLLVRNLWHELTVPSGTIYTPASGVQTIVETPEFTASTLPLIVLCALLLLALRLPAVLREFARADKGSSIKSPVPSPTQSSQASSEEAADDWRVGHQGRDCMYYEEWHDGAWRRLDISGEMLMGRAHHAIYFDPPARWQHHPEWARHRRKEIIERIKSRFAPPDYEYYGDADLSVSANNRDTAAGNSAKAAPVQAISHRGSPSSHVYQRTYASAITGLVAVSMLMVWLVSAGLEKGAVRSFARYSGGQLLSRAEEPMLYWLSILLLAAVGIGCIALGGWLAVQWYRGRRSGSCETNKS